MSLTETIESKFGLPGNTAVFTTTHVVLGKSPIIYVSHDEDGAWQFFSSEGAEMDHAMIVALSEMINIDNSLLTLADLPGGFSASRNTKEEKWQIKK